MGSDIKTNDTLQITSEQGFPVELNLEQHLANPISLESVKGKIFSFLDKPSLRIYHAPPVRNFLVQNIDGKWVYWGLVHILSVTHDMLKGTTSGTYEIIYLNTPDEMKQAHNLIDRNPKTQYFT